MTKDLPRHGYGRVTRALHWIMAAAILALILLGLAMTRLPAAGEGEVARVFFAYSVHKTLGIVALGLALLRLDWTRRHPGPGPLHPARRIETAVARTVHATLWGAMLILPPTGLILHSAAPGFAPILWPFGQALPFVPADEDLARSFTSVHRAAGWLLIGALALHILGTLKHVLVDRDATLARMATGKGPAVAPARGAGPAALAALGLWAAAILAGILSAPPPEPDPFDTLDFPAPSIGEPLPVSD